MAELSGSVPTTLGALVGAATFAAGFLSTRVHRQRDHAMAVAQQMDDRMDEAALDGTPIDPHLARNQLRALDEASSDRLDVVALGSVVLLASAVAVLSWLVARDADLGWSSQDGWVVLAFVAAAVVVLLASVVDLVGARREVAKRRRGTVLGLLERADALWRKPSGTAEAVRLAETAVRQSRGLLGPAWQVLGNAHLAAMSASLPDPETWLKAWSCLDRASQLGPESMALSWARGYAIERGPDPDPEAAAREHVRGCWLSHEASRPLARGDTVIDPPHVREEKALRSGKAGRSVMQDPSALRFRPTLPATLALALGRIPALYAEAGLTAELLRGSTVDSPEDVQVALDATVEWLERIRDLTGVFGVAMVSTRADALLAGAAAPAYRDGVAAHVRNVVAEEAAAVRADEERQEEQARAREEDAQRLNEHLEALTERAERMTQQAQRPHRDQTGDAEEVDWAAQLEELEAQIAQRRREAAQSRAEQAQEEEESRRLTEQMHERVAALERRSAGRATEQDLEELRDLHAAHPDTPWPEPRPRPGEEVAPGTAPGQPAG